ncbi:MAG: hypothetical protein M0038_09780, partial [Pseudomonadota bacterium]|nr:hypothetical protein [Pseudomonadota bacterium]
MAAYLRMMDAETYLRGCLLVINSVGEPVEFCHASIARPESALWRASDLRRRCAAALTRSLFEICSSQPRIVLALASELDPAVFRGDVQPAIAACRVVPGDPAQNDEGELATSDGPRLIWAS